jgi:hypothetical protein
MAFQHALSMLLAKRYARICSPCSCTKMLAATGVAASGTAVIVPGFVWHSYPSTPGMCMG